MKITVDYQWSEMAVPPRCRKPRWVPHQGTTVVEVPEVTSAQAPVAFRVPSRSQDEYRWFNEQLWLPYLPASGQTEPTLPGSASFPDHVTARTSDPQPIYADYLIIDGAVWAAAFYEPRYVVQTFGLGRNHGGTGLFVDNGYNSNIRKSAYYRADEYDAAVTEALRVAADRGDTESVATIKRTRPIEVLIPEAVREATNAQMRAEEEDEARATFQKALVRVCHQHAHQWNELTDRADDLIKALIHEVRDPEGGH